MGLHGCLMYLWSVRDLCNELCEMCVFNGAGLRIL